MKKKLVSIVIPVYNEEKNIPRLVTKISETINNISSYTFEILIVENASHDETFPLLLKVNKKDPRFKIIQLARNAGCDGAIIAGLSYAKGEAAIIIMADLQENPNLIPKFIKKWEEGYDDVYGIVKRRPGMKTYKKIGTF